MANRYFLNIGANWGDTANWSDTSGGAGGFSVPTNADDVFFDGSSGNCTVNATGRVAKSLNFTGYTNTITMTFAITVSGNVTLDAAMGINGLEGLTVNATSTFTSNLRSWPNSLTIATNGTVTLADNMYLSDNSTLIVNSNTSNTINSNTIYLSGSFSFLSGSNPLLGTTLLYFNGSGTISSLSSSSIRLNLTFDTGSFYYLSGTFRYQTNTFTCIKGRIIPLADSIFFLAACTLINIDRLAFTNVTILSGQTITMNKFFNGTASVPTRIQCSTATGTYTIAFQDTFEKISFNTKVSGLITSRPNQLILTSPNANKGFNTGVRYGNQYPNRIPLNSPTVPTQMVFGIGNISDPTRVTT